MDTKPIQRRKSAEKRKEKFLRVRVSDQQKELIDTAANLAGITVSAWVLERLLQIARKEVAARTRPP
jgi:uncharacterized protein (DUF1778 family)